jgi:hypothetical protein
VPVPKPLMLTSRGRRNHVLAWALVGCAFEMGCASSTSMRAAEAGDRVSLRDLLEKRESAGTLSNGEAKSLASAVAAHDVRVASAADAPFRVRELQPCARELDDVLAERMRTRDAAGARAALERIESGQLGSDWARSALSDSAPEWRAVGARALVRHQDREARARALLDPEPEVRRQAARAARDAADAADFDTLAEAARVDPEPIVRTEAVRAIAVLPTLAGDRAAQVLGDLWTVGDSALRGDIARAWASASIWPAGGRGALENVIAAQHGSEAIEAAAAVLAHHDAPEDVANLAAAAITAAIAQGSEASRIQALVEAPLDRSDLREALKVAARDEDRQVRIAALGRLAEHDAAARSELEELARPGQRLGDRARFALGLAGDRRAQAWIEEDLQAQSAQMRVAAVTALAALGVAARGASLLADEDPSVRERAACAIVMAARVAR